MKFFKTQIHSTVEIIINRLDNQKKGNQKEDDQKKDSQIWRTRLRESWES